MKKKHIIIATIISLLFIVGIVNKNTKSIKPDIMQNNQSETIENTIIKKEIDINLLDGKSFISNYKVENDNISIVYSKNNLSNNNLTEKDYNNYFMTGNKVNRILVSVPLRLFRDYDYINTVDITIKTDKNHNINISRGELNKFLGEEITKNTIDKYTYDKNLLNNFLKHFTK